MAIRQVLADIETKVEALTPVTGSVSYRFVTTFPANLESLNELGASSSHRSVYMFRDGSAVQATTGTTRIWETRVTLRLVHVWKRANFQESEIIRAEDVHQIIECMLARIPGNASNAGARIWKLEDERVDVIGDRSITSLSFGGTLGLPEVVAPA